MLKYVIKRLLLAVMTLFIILSLTFILLHLLPYSKPLGTSSAQIAYYSKEVSLGYLVTFTAPDPSYGTPLYVYTVALQSGEKVTHYIYQVPVLQQYFRWLGNVLTKWDWGVSTQVQPNVDVLVIILNGLPITIEVNVLSVIIAVPAGIALGIWAALKKNKPTDHIISTLVMIFISVPSFVVITFMIMTFGYAWNILPTAWAKSTDPFKAKALAFVIPVFALSFGSICGYCRFTRAELCDVLASDYLLLARTKGLTKNQAVIRHALRNAMVPILPSILAEIVGILSGSMILETLYGIPGIGSLFYDAISSRDYNVLMVDMSLFTAIGLVSGIILDLSYGFLDPRIRMGEK